MQAISIKELRQQLPFVRSELKKGTEFLVIYQSRPIAKLSPVSALSDFGEATDDDIERAAIQDAEKEYLTKKEVKHYLALK